MNNIKKEQKFMKIYDAFLFYNELDLLEIRLNILKDKVDYFIIGEAVQCFNGNAKPLYFEENKELNNLVLP